MSGSSSTAFSLTSDQMVTVSVTFFDSQGNLVTSGLSPLWTTSDETILTINPSQDNMSCDVTTVGPNGSAEITVMDTNSGVSTQQFFSVTASTTGPVTSALMSVGTPFPKPTSTPSPTSSSGS